MKTITMKSYKYNNKIHYESELELVKVEKTHIVTHGHANRKLIHYTRNETFVFNNHSLELFFFDRWYTVACVFNSMGNIVSYYINIAMPSKYNKSTKVVSFIDLDLDVLIEPNLTYRVVDRDEFKLHQIKYSYPKNLIVKTEKALKNLISDIEKRNFPFNGYIKSNINEIIN